LGIFDRLRARNRTPAPRQNYAKPNYALTVRTGNEVSRVLLPIDPYDSLDELSSEGPRQEPGQCWRPAGSAVEIAGRQIGGGLIYVGANLPAAEHDFLLEPALIDPGLPVGNATSAVAESYWPSYESLPPGDRGGYLDWLAGPRRAVGTDQTFLFLYFYGLERRLLFDPANGSGAADDREAVLAELRRLQAELDEHQHHSLSIYLQRLLDFVEAQELLAGRRELQPPEEKSGWEVPMTLRLMIGEVAAAGLRLPAELAKCLALTSPEAYLRTPAQRCRLEFGELFQIRYRERFGEGLELAKGAFLQLRYRTASQGLGDATQNTQLPDVCNSDMLIVPLRELGRDCCGELDAYSRWLGRNPDGGGFKGAALLPAPLLHKVESPQLVALRELVGRASAGDKPWAIDSTELIELWSPDAEKLSKKEAVMAAQLLEKLGYGIEPDPRFGGPSLKREMTAVLFSAENGDPRAPSPAYAAARLMLDLLTAVAAADGVVSAEEEAELESHIHGVQELYQGERARLKAHANRLALAPLKLSGQRKQLAALTEAERRAIAQSVVTLAAADGEIDPAEVKMLQRIFTLLELDPEGVYADLHAVTSGGADGPVVVREGGPAAAGHAIPPAPESQPRKGLDRAAIDEKIEETAVVSTLLADIFTETEEKPEPAPAVASPAEDANGLAPPDLAFAQELRQRELWSRQEIEELAAHLELMVDGSLEAINEAAFELCGAPFSAGDEPVEIDIEVAKEMLP
jgi:uncharacterized tellurite resistance protein B-like protein